jgi:hypothetical protein
MPPDLVRQRRPFSAATNNNVQGMPDNQALKSYLREEGYVFEELDLIKAMAACMTGLDQMMQEIRS